MKRLFLFLLVFGIAQVLYSQCSVTVLSQTDPTCPGYCNGTAKIQPVGQGPFSIIWLDTYETTDSVSSLCGGWGYSVEITDDTGCVASTVITLTEPPYPTISAVVEDETCMGACDGSIIMSITGNYPPYEIIWNYGEYEGDTITGLCGGMGGDKPVESAYFADITDSQGCMFFDSYYLMGGAGVEIYINNITPSDCTPNGSIDLEIFAESGGGQAKSLTYLWSTGATTEDVFNVGMGYYYITATDTNGCFNVDTFFVPLAAGNFPELSVSSYQNTNCLATNNDNGFIKVNAVGTPPIMFQWSNGVSGQDIDSIGGLTPGIYRVTVTDGGAGTNSCSNILEYEILDDNLKIEIWGWSTDCPNYTNGYAIVDVLAGVTPVTYLWDYDNNTNYYVDLLDAGLYTVTVTDGAGCTAVATYGVGYNGGILDSMTVKQYACYGQGDGALRVKVNGYPPYTYSWSNGMLFSNVAENYSEISGLSPGTYSVTVTDSSPFSYTCNNAFGWAVIEEPSELLYTTQVSDLSCNGDFSGSVEVMPDGGWGGPYYYDWSHDSGYHDSNPTSLAAGTYLFTVTDIHGCSESDFLIVNEPAAMVLSALNITPVNCGTVQTGTAEVTVVQGLPPYEFLWSNGDTQALADSLAAAIYSVTVTDVNGCTQQAYGEVTELPGWQISGIVQSTAGPLAPGSAQIHIYKEMADVFQIQFENMTTVEGGGYYQIDGLTAGTYHISARPDTLIYNDYLNTWYPGVVAWENSFDFSMQCGDTVSNITIDILELPVLAGNGSFSGFIYYWDNTKLWREVGEPVEGAEVFVEQQPNDEPVANTNTDVGGYWEVNGLEENYSYSIHVEVPGLPVISTYSNIPVTPTSSDYENLNFFVDTTNTFGGIFIDTLVGVSAAADVIMEIYPNPVQDQIHISFTSETDQFIGWELFAADGRKVSEGTNIYISSGKATLQIPVIERGVYYLNVSLGSNRYIKKLVKE